MKNQYIGDIGDYGKYGLLRFLESKGVRLGINWYMTPNDGKNDGSLNDYLNDDQFREYDEELFRVLQRLTPREGHRVKAPIINDIENAKLFTNVEFYHQCMDFEGLQNWRVREKKREEWHRNALDTLKDASLVFADPDNGLSDMNAGKKQSQKYILPREVEDYYNRGQDVVYYHHRSRQSRERWLATKQRMKYLDGCGLFATSFHRWSSRTYIFVIHKEHEKYYQKIIQEFLASPWGTYKVNKKTAFSLEEI